MTSESVTNVMSFRPDRRLNWPCLIQNRFQQEEIKFRHLPDQLPYENQLHVRAAEEDAAAGDLCSDAVSMDEAGRGVQPGDPLLLLGTWTGQWVGAHWMGGQPHWAAG